MTTETEGEKARGFEHFEEMSTYGLLWLINRTVFHPRGFALAFMKEADGTVSGWKVLGDGSEVWTFDPDADDEEFAKASAYLQSLSALSPHGEQCETCNPEESE